MGDLFANATQIREEIRKTCFKIDFVWLLSSVAMKPTEPNYEMTN
jgi:hypothetical protein